MGTWSLIDARGTNSWPGKTLKIYLQLFFFHFSDEFESKSLSMHTYHVFIDFICNNRQTMFLSNLQYLFHVLDRIHGTARIRRTIKNDGCRVLIDGGLQRLQINFEIPFRNQIVEFGANSVTMCQRLIQQKTWTRYQNVLSGIGQQWYANIKCVWTAARDKHILWFDDPDKTSKQKSIRYEQVIRRIQSPGACPDDITCSFPSALTLGLIGSFSVLEYRATASRATGCPLLGRYPLNFIELTESITACCTSAGAVKLPNTVGSPSSVAKTSKLKSNINFFLIQSQYTYQLKVKSTIFLDLDVNFPQFSESD